jgi:hypothetical protein
VSNHTTSQVFIYANASALNENSDPDGILRSVCYPHGVRFTSDGRFISGQPHGLQRSPA